MSEFIWKRSTDKLREYLKSVELKEYGVKTTGGKKQGKPLAFPTPINMLDAIVEYFEAVDDNPYLIHDFVGKDASSVNRRHHRPYTWHALCLYLGYNTIYFNRFEEQCTEKGFRGGDQYCKVITHARDIIYDNKFSGASSGIFSHHIIARDLGLADKKQIEGGDKPIQLLGGQAADTVPKE